MRRRTRSRSLSRCAPVLVCLLLSFGCIQSLEAAPKETPNAERIGKLLDAGQAVEALEAAYEALTYDADDITMLELASQAAEKAERKDEALWLTQLAVRTALTEGAKAPVKRRLSARAKALDPLPESERPALEGYARRLFDLAELCVKRRLYANAVDFYGRCAATPLAQEAEKRLRKLYTNRRAVDAILASGIDVPLRPTNRKAARRKLKEDAKHATWEKAWKIKGDNYTVKTNAGWALGSAVLDAMEQINRFYRKVFQHKQRGGGTARCTIRLYGSREDFETYENEQDPTVGGFYSTENYVACYDPRGDSQRAGELWETLFHEAAHQFTHMISTGTIPGWLDEGTAVYFEGTRRQANGRVETNLVHEGRLEHLKEVLEKGSPTLREVVSWYADESYPLDYYPVGGYLVYFFKNYEDEECERIYAPLFDAYMRTYRSGGKHSPFDRFVDFFIKKARQPGVETFADFVQRFKTWSLQLYDLQFGPPERADKLIERAERQRRFGKYQAALESYRWALEKRENDPRALLGIAEVHTQLKENDAAVYAYRRLVELARRAEDKSVPLDGDTGPTAAALLERCGDCIAKIDGIVAKAVDSSDAEFIEQVRAAASKYAEAGYPRVAVGTLATASSAVSVDHALEPARHALEAEHGVHASLWRRLSTDLSDWVYFGKWSLDDDVLTGSADERGAQLCLLREQMPERYRFDATIQIRRQTGAEPFVGILFGIDDGAAWDVLGVSGGGEVDVSHVVVDWKVLKELPSLKGKTDQPFTLGVEVDRGRVRFFVDGKHVYAHSYPVAELQGRIGVLVQDVDATFTNLRVSY